MSDLAIAVFTGEPAKNLLRFRFSEAWRLRAARARQIQYIVCVRNRHNWDRRFDRTDEPHGSAFLVGRIGAILPAPDEPLRWRVTIVEHAGCLVENVWRGWQNPVRYTSLADLGVKFSALQFTGAPAV